MTNKQVRYLTMQISMAIEIPAFLAIAAFSHGVIGFICGAVGVFGLIASFMGAGSWREIEND